VLLTAGLGGGAGWMATAGAQPPPPSRSPEERVKQLEAQLDQAKREVELQKARERRSPAPSSLSPEERVTPPEVQLDQSPEERLRELGAQYTASLWVSKELSRDLSPEDRAKVQKWHVDRMGQLAPQLAQAMREVELQKRRRADGAGAGPSSRAKWDYRFAPVTEMDADQFVKVLEDWGAVGWEYTGQATLTKDGKAASWWIFRRR
jgi:hypothetical protein